VEQTQGAAPQSESWYGCSRKECLAEADIYEPDTGMALCFPHLEEFIERQEAIAESPQLRESLPPHEYRNFAPERGYRF
jgi:hypothetical protein